jgi:hypothetical protein
LVAGFRKWRAQPLTRKKYTIVDRFPLPPGAPFIGDTSLTHVMMLAAHSTKPPTPTTMVQYFILYYYITCILSRIPPPPRGTAILPEYIHYYG